MVPLDSISVLVLTHLTPKRLASLQALLQARGQGAPQLEVYLSNPALQLLRSKLGGGPHLLGQGLADGRACASAWQQHAAPMQLARCDLPCEDRLKCKGRLFEQHLGARHIAHSPMGLLKSISAWPLRSAHPSYTFKVAFFNHLRVLQPARSWSPLSDVPHAVAHGVAGSELELHAACMQVQVKRALPFCQP